MLFKPHTHTHTHTIIIIIICCDRKLQLVRPVLCVGLYVRVFTEKITVILCATTTAAGDISYGTRQRSSSPAQSPADKRDIAGAAVLAQRVCTHSPHSQQITQLSCLCLRLCAFTCVCVCVPTTRHHIIVVKMTYPRI